MMTLPELKWRAAAQECVRNPDDILKFAAFASFCQTSSQPEIKHLGAVVQAFLEQSQAPPCPPKGEATILQFATHFASHALGNTFAGELYNHLISHHIPSRFGDQVKNMQRWSYRNRRKGIR
jgi:hypothetical protein